METKRESLTERQTEKDEYKQLIYFTYIERGYAI